MSEATTLGFVPAANAAKQIEEAARQIKAKGLHDFVVSVISENANEWIISVSFKCPRYRFWNGLLGNHFDLMGFDVTGTADQTAKDVMIYLDGSTAPAYVIWSMPMLTQHHWAGSSFADCLATIRGFQ